MRVQRNEDVAIERTNRARTAGLAVDLFLLFALSTLWGASYAFIRIGVETIPPLTLIAARTFIADGTVQFRLGSTLFCHLNL